MAVQPQAMRVGRFKRTKVEQLVTAAIEAPPQVDVSDASTGLGIHNRDIDDTSRRGAWP